MTPEQWRRLQALFDEVTQAPAAERQSILQKVEQGVDDPSLLRELRRLVDHSEPDPSFLRPIPGVLTGSSISAGTVVAGRFEILRLIGRGGMGEVFEALDRKLGEPVAIKVIVPGYGRDPGTLERFLREAQIARRISHPNVCRIHDVGEHAGTPYLSMELLAGETLAARLERGPLSLEECEGIARQLFDGLHAAHSVGIVHRDLKPSNLMLVGARLVILDFGLARPILGGVDGSLTHSGTLIGTLDWMAPEQLLGEFDKRSDLYSAALLLLEALRGKRLEHESGGLAGALRRATGDTDFRKLLPAGLPAPWRYVLLRCLERDPSRRPANAQEVQKLLTLKGNLLFATVRNLPRSRWVKIVAASAMLVALVLLGLRYLQHQGLKPGALIMVTTTNNATGDPRFDGLTSLLRADLQQSANFNVWDGQRQGTVLRVMRQDAQFKPEAKEWREMAVREGAQLLVFATLSRLSDGYALTISSEPVGTTPQSAGRSREHLVKASGPATLFEAVREAAAWIRTTAGETEFDLSAHNRLPQDITTSEWEALRLFDQAQSLTAAQRPVDAIPVLERAVQLDSQFAMAHMRLGDVLNSQNRSEEGFAHWKLAIDLAKTQHLSEHERLRIESRYAMEIKDFKAAEPVLRAWAENFPNDSAASELLASCLIAVGRYDEGIRWASQAQLKFGKTVFGTSVLIRALAAKNRLPEMEAQIKILDALSVPQLASQFRGMEAALRGDYGSSARIFGELVSRGTGTESSRAARMLANLEADRGELDQASSVLRNAIPRDREAGEDGMAAQKTVALAFLEEQTGNKNKARGLAEAAVALTASPQVVLEAVTVLARTGDLTAARRLSNKFPDGPGPRFQAAKLRMQGEILSAMGDFQQAVELLDQAAEIDRPQYPKEYLARVLDLAGDRNRAKLIYQSLVDTPWLIWAWPEDEWPGIRFLAQQRLKQGE